MAFTEFYVTKGSAVADTNGGGPRLGTNDGPTYALTAGASGATATDNGADSNIEDLNNGSWGDTAIDDWLCFDTGGAKEFTQVTAIDVGADTDIITVSPQVTAAAEKGCNVCGAWATVDHAASTVDTTFVNAAGDTPRVNIKYNAAAYDETVQFDNAGTTAIPLRFEGYNATAGDLSDTMPTISNAGDVSGGVVYSAGTIDYLKLVNFAVSASGVNIEAIKMSSDYSYFHRLKVDTGAGDADGLFNNGHSCIYDNVHAFSTGRDGIIVGNQNQLFNCVSTDAGGVGIQTGTHAAIVGCISDTATEDGFVVGYASIIDNCVGYATSAGSGVKLAAQNILVRNSIFTNNNQYGIEASASFYLEEDYNSFHNNGVAETVNVPNRGANDVSLSGDPFTNAAGGDFSLDATAGEGAACRAAGFPGALLDGTNVGYADIGALQHQDAGAGGLLVHPSMTGGIRG